MNLYLMGSAIFLGCCLFAFSFRTGALPKTWQEVTAVLLASALWPVSVAAVVVEAQAPGMMNELADQAIIAMRRKK